jgi:uncharacterized protein (TIGR00369 family)
MNGHFSLPPYAIALDMAFVEETEEMPIIAMPFATKVQGRPGFLHGGAISGLLEMAAVSAIWTALQTDGRNAGFKQVNVTIDFMRGGIPQTSFAQGTVTRLGRNMANVEAKAWQDDRAKPIAVAHLHYLISNRVEQVQP